MSRIIINALWQVRPDQDPSSVFHGTKGFFEHARSSLAKTARDAGSDLRMNLSERYGKSLYVFSIQWTIDFEHDIDDQEVAHLENRLHQVLQLSLSSRSAALDLIGTMRHSPADAIDIPSELKAAA